VCNQDTCVYFNGLPSVVIGNIKNINVYRQWTEVIIKLLMPNAIKFYQLLLTFNAINFEKLLTVIV
jgi:hypothetical protein